MSVFWMVENDTSPPLVVTVKKPDGSVVALNAVSSVRFHLRDSTGRAVVDAPAEVYDAANGKLRYLWQPGDLSEAGEYDGEFELTWADGTVQTVPNPTLIRVSVRGEIA